MRATTDLAIIDTRFSSDLERIRDDGITEMEDGSRMTGFVCLAVTDLPPDNSNGCRESYGVIIISAAVCNGIMD